MAVLTKKQVAKLEIGSKVATAVTDFFDAEGFIQLRPVMLGMSTDPLGPDPGSAVIKTGQVEYLGQNLSLMNSMILHKQVAVRETGRKIWIMSPNIRLEGAQRKETKRHLFEFTQADFEIPDAKMKDVMALVEKFYVELSQKLKDLPEWRELSIAPFAFRGPFKVYEIHEMEERYGKDWELAASKGHDQPFWVVCHKREFYDKEDPERPGHYLNYDLIYPKGFGEALSGAEREHDYQRILARMGRDRLEMKIYDAYLKKAREGFRQSAGAGFGIERLVRFLTESDHVGDVQLFRRVPGEPVEI